MKIGVLALQGAFIEHKSVMEKLGAICFEIRQKSDLKESFDGIILPGGESTVQGMLLKSLGMLGALKEKIHGGLPVLATCAGLILLAGKIENNENVYLGTLPVTVRRNAFGRQISSFARAAEVKDIGKFKMIFIRAPYIQSAGKEVEPLAEVDGKTVAVKYKNQIALAFHPELGNDCRIHKYFLETAAAARKNFS